MNVSQVTGKTEYDSAPGHRPRGVLGSENENRSCRPDSRRDILLPMTLPIWPNLVTDPTEADLRKLASIGFRVGDKGTHTSRTMMLSELSDLFQFIPENAAREIYVRAIINDNILAKNTHATRKLTSQRLSELYSFDLAVPLFRILRLFWERDRHGRPLLSLLMALARDPLLRATADCVLKMTPGEELGRQSMTDAIRAAVDDRLNESTLDKVVRNTASSWTQSGHLDGRSRKFRKRVSATPATLANALFLAYALGMRGDSLLRSAWVRALDLGEEEAGALAFDAKRLGFLDMTRGGGVTEISFARLLTEREKELLHGTN